MEITILVFIFHCSWEGFSHPFVHGVGCPKKVHTPRGCPEDAAQGWRFVWDSGNYNWPSKMHSIQRFFNEFNPTFYRNRTQVPP